MTEAEQQKLDKKKRKAAQGLVDRIKLQFSLKNIKTWHDVYKWTGYDATHIKSSYDAAHLATAVTFDDIKSWCATILDGVEKSITAQNENKKEEPKKVEPQLPASPVERDTGVGVLVKDREIPSSNSATGKTSSVQSISTDEQGYTNENNYGLSVSEKEKAFLYYFQKKAAAEILDKIIKDKKPAVLLIASTGTGKTFIQGAVKRRLIDNGFMTGKTYGHVENLSITRATVVEQTARVFRNFFGINTSTDTEVINIEQLRSRAGAIWIKEYNTIKDGQEVEVVEWKPFIHPVVIDWDECQALKNEDSKQHKIAVAYSSLEAETTQFFISATPFTRVSEAKAFAIATKKDISHITGIPNTRLSASTWNTFATYIAQGDPTEYNEAAVERLMKELDDYIVRVKGVRWQFNAKNTVKIIDFEPPDETNDFTDTLGEYTEAWNKFLERKAKLEESVTDNPRFQALIELGIFLAAAEYAKRYIFAKRMYQDVQAGKAAVLAVKFKKTIIAVTRILHEKYGVPRDQISLIWGGGQTQLTAKQKLKAKYLENKEKFEEAGISMEDMMLADVETRILEDLPEHLRLGNQSKDDRQKEIDRFQSGRSLYAIYTYKAGGVGLSLHHTDELSPIKVRRQKNGYAVVEDIPNVPVRPRKVTIGPTWSAIELVQGCGRAPRLTSLSDTDQEFLYYKGTVEEDQAFVVTHKLKCLTKVVRQHENWQDLIVNHSKAKELAKNFVDATKDKETEEPETSVGEGEEGEEE